VADWLKLIRLLIEKGADVNLPDDAGLTPLMWASLPGRPKVIKAGFISSPTTYFVSSGSPQIVEALLDAKAKVDMQNKQGATALHYAAVFGPVGKLEALVSRGANVNAPDSDGDTPLIYAVGRDKSSDWRGNAESVRFLIGKGANVNSKNKKGRTVSQNAKKGSYLAALLVENKPSLPIPQGQAHRPTDPAKALVYIYRESYLEGSRLKPSAFCDDVQLARLQDGRYFAIQVAPGEHVFKFDSLKTAGVKIEFEANRVYYLRVINAWNAHIEMPSADEGWFMIENAKPHDAENIKDTTLVLQTPPNSRK